MTLARNGGGSEKVNSPSDMEGVVADVDVAEVTSGAAQAALLAERSVRVVTAVARDDWRRKFLRDSSMLLLLSLLMLFN
jgi:hypothetical protein